MSSYKDYVIHWRKRAAEEGRHLEELKKKAYKAARQCALSLAQGKL